MVGIMPSRNCLRVVWFVATSVTLSCSGAQAQRRPPIDTTRADSGHAGMDMGVMKSPELMLGPLGVPVDRMGSGTTWIPDAVSLPSLRTMAGQWDLMMHGFGFIQYDVQGGPRGDAQFGSLNWAMLMASHVLGGGRLQFRTMLSLDAATVTSRGYPLLLQTGESYGGVPLRDRQHPHDFWMELGVLYERAMTERVGVFLYGAPSGEPALGPVAFMHRPSAMDSPFAPLSHHWADATHITFGVVTAGLFGSGWKLEGSLFNGREPNEERWGFDRIRIDSYSVRLTINPNPQWSVTAGHGFLRSPEALDPSETIRRFTGSVLHSRRFGTSGRLAAAAVWGANQHSGSATHSLLLEGDARFDRHNSVLLRAELVQKTAEDLLLGGVSPDQAFSVGAASAGYVWELARPAGLTIGLGAEGTLSFLPAAVATLYGGTVTAGGVLFLRVRPADQ